MTRTEQQMDAPVPEPFGVIAAFLDGERVDGAALKSALATADGRDYLVDVLALRRSVLLTPTSVVAPVVRERRPIASRWAAAIVVAGLSSVAGYAVGERTGFAAERAASPGVEAVTQLAAPTAAPQPTIVIQLESSRSADAAGGQ
jgi:hypothetical protein